MTAPPSPSPDESRGAGGAAAAPGIEEGQPRSAGVPEARAESAGPVRRAVQGWASAHKIELLLFLLSAAVLASFSSHRFLRQSAAPHFVYQAKGWLEGRLDLDPAVLPNLEDWACVREVAGEKLRCEGRVLPTDRWFVSFPPFPAVLMAPFVALQGYQLNDTSFGVLVGALAIALFFSLLRLLRRQGETERGEREDVLLALTLGFGTLFFYCAIRGEVWFFAQVLGVALTCLYLRYAIGARRPVLAGLFFSMAVLTRTPLVFAGLFFVLEALCPGPGSRLAQLEALPRAWRGPARSLGLFAVGAAPLALLGAIHNVVRFGAPGEFGHRFLYNNRVNADIDRLGLFSLEYLPRNLRAAFLELPSIRLQPFRLDYDPHGLALWLTLPLIVLLLLPRRTPRLHWPLWLTVGLVALPGLLYQNTGYMQFGFRFSLDYTPYLLLLFAIGGWSLKARPTALALGLGFLVNFWGAVAFRGYTELVRSW